MLMTKIRRKMQIGIWIIAILFIGGIFLVFGVGTGVKDNGARNKDKKSKTILIVEGKKIPRTLYDYELTQVMNSIPYKVDNYQMRMLVAAQTVKRMLQQEVLIKEAGKRGLKVTSGEIKSRIKGDRDRIVGPVNAPKNPGLPDRVKLYFAESRKNKEYREFITASGIQYKTYKDAVKRELLAEKVRNVIAQEQTQEEAKNVEKKARDAWRKLRKGEPFAGIAKQYSEDQATKDNEGLLGWKTRADLDKVVAEMAFRLEPGTYSEPIRSNLGFQIIKVEAVKKAIGQEYEQFRQQKLQEIQQTKDAKMPSERELQRMYESVLLKHILFSIKDHQTLVAEWAQKRVESKDFKHTVLDPEIRAFMALQDSMDRNAQAFTQKGLDKALKSYNAALKKEPDNYNLYYQIGYIYEQKNDLLNKAIEETRDKSKDKKFEDPFEEGDSGKDKKKDKTVKYLDSAYESYKEAYDMASNAGNDDPDIILGLARVSKLLADNGTKDVAKYKKQARRYYTDAYTFSPNLTVSTLYRLREIRDALKDLGGDKKILAELDKTIADIEMEMGMSQPPSEPQQFTVGDENGEGPRTVTIKNEDGTTREISIDDLIKAQQGDAESKTPPAMPGETTEATEPQTSAPKPVDSKPVPVPAGGQQ